MNSAVEQVYIYAKDLALELLGDRLIAVYLFGSLSHGGFSETSSDIDIAFILNGSVSKKEWDLFAKLDNLIQKSKLPFSDRVSIFWSTTDVLSTEKTSGAFPPPTTSQGVFPPFDVLDLLQNGKLIYGSDIKNLLRVPEINDLYIAGVEFLLSYVNTPERNKYLHNFELFRSQEPGKISKTILFPVRLAYTLTTGKIGNNDEAISNFRNQPSMSEPSKVLLEQAARIRDGRQHDIATLHTAYVELVQLYISIIEMHEKKMIELAEIGYVTQLRSWKEDLKNR